MSINEGWDKIKENAKSILKFNDSVKDIDIEAGPGNIPLEVLEKMKKEVNDNE